MRRTACSFPSVDCGPTARICARLSTRCPASITQSSTGSKYSPPQYSWTLLLEAQVFWAANSDGSRTRHRALAFLIELSLRVGWLSIVDHNFQYAVRSWIPLHLGPKWDLRATFQGGPLAYPTLAFHCAQFYPPRPSFEANLTQCLYIHPMHLQMIFRH